MNCEVCKISCFKKILHRTNEFGQNKPGWMCLSCIEKKEPELSKNIKTSKYFNQIKIIEKIVLNDIQNSNFNPPVKIEKM